MVVMTRCGGAEKKVIPGIAVGTKVGSCSQAQPGTLLSTQKVYCSRTVATANRYLTPTAATDNYALPLITTFMSSPFLVILSSTSPLLPPPPPPLPPSS